MNGDGRAELLGSWTGQGVYWRNNATGAWTQLGTPATKITAGDLDGDGIADLDRDLAVAGRSLGEI